MMPYDDLKGKEVLFLLYSPLLLKGMRCNSCASSLSLSCTINMEDIKEAYE